MGLSGRGAALNKWMVEAVPLGPYLAEVNISVHIERDDAKIFERMNSSVPLAPERVSVILDNVS